MTFYIKYNKYFKKESQVPPPPHLATVRYLFKLSNLGYFFLNSVLFTNLQWCILDVLYFLFLNLIFVSIFFHLYTYYIKRHIYLLQTLYTYPDNFRAQKALIAAKYSGADLTVAKDFVFGETNKSADFLKKFPLGKVRILL